MRPTPSRPPWPLRRHLRPLPHLREDQRPLQHRLHVVPNALGRPRRVRHIPRLRLLHVPHQFRHMLGHVPLARRPDRRMRFVQLLRKRPQQTTELTHRPPQDLDPKIHVSQQPLYRVRVFPVGRLPKQPRRHPRKVIRRRDPQRFLALEVVKETPLRHPRRRAHIINRRRGVPTSSSRRKKGRPAAATRPPRHAGDRRRYPEGRCARRGGHRGWTSIGG